MSVEGELLQSQQIVNIIVFEEDVVIEVVDSLVICFRLVKSGLKMPSLLSESSSMTVLRMSLVSLRSSFSSSKFDPSDIL